MTAKEMLNLEQLRQAVQCLDIDTVLVMFTDCYGRFVGKRFDAEFFLETVAESGTHACNYLLTVDMEMEPTAGYDFANWSKGYGDFHLTPDLSTLRGASWLERSALVICDVENDDHSPVSIAPRSILKQQLDRAGQLGLEIQSASELEYYMFSDSFQAASSQHYSNMESTGWYIEDYHMLQGSRVEQYNARIRRALGESGIPVESTKGEWGLGQHEINIRYAEALQMCDRHVLLKQCMKELADQMEMSVTFMAKYSAQQAGSSCHIHMSLWKQGRNCFDDAGNYSDTLRHFVAGWLERFPEIMVWLAPTVNSYKRFQPGSWAPTRLAWSRDNRTAAIRVVGQGKSLRVECRVPGADCNPYLAYAALLAAGLDGIEQQREPPEIFSGDVYSTVDFSHVPRNLNDALRLFETSDFVASCFGETVQSHYSHFFRTELTAFENAVTDWEKIRYFERI